MIEAQNNIRELLDLDLNLPNSPYSGHRTYSSLFLTPAFSINLNSDLYDYFINTYIDDYDFKHLHERPLFLLTETLTTGGSYKEVDRELRLNKNFRHTYIAGTHKGMMLIMYVFECPDEYKADYDRFLKGQYSKFSEKYKERFPKVTRDSKGKYVESPLYGAIYKTATFKKQVEKMICDPKEGERLDPNQEYFGIPSRKIEIFRYD